MQKEREAGAGIGMGNPDIKFKGETERVQKGRRRFICFIKTCRNVYSVAQVNKKLFFFIKEIFIIKNI